MNVALPRSFPNNENRRVCYSKLLVFYYYIRQFVYFGLKTIKQEIKNTFYGYCARGCASLRHNFPQNIYIKNLRVYLEKKMFQYLKYEGDLTI